MIIRNFGTQTAVGQIPCLFKCMLFSAIVLIVLFVLETFLEITKFSPMNNTLQEDYVAKLLCLKENSVLISSLSIPVYTARHKIYPLIKARDKTKLPLAIRSILQWKMQQRLVHFDEAELDIQKAFGEKWSLYAVLYSGLEKVQISDPDKFNIKPAFDKSDSFFMYPENYFMFAYDPLFEVPASSLSFFTFDQKWRHNGMTCRQESFQHAFLVPPTMLGPLDAIFVPFYWDQQPQILSAKVLAVGLHMMSEFGTGGKGIRLGYNSPGACPIKNHFHFQVWSFANRLPIEQASVHLIGLKDVTTESDNKTVAGEIDIFELDEYPVHAFVYHIENNDVLVIAEAVMHCVNALIEQSIPHSLLINQRALFLIPRQQHQKSMAFSANLGFPELAGVVYTGNKDEFKMAKKNTDIVFNVLQSKVSVSNSSFRKLKENCLKK